jgi:hypothetical protein
MTNRKIKEERLDPLLGCFLGLTLFFLLSEYTLKENFILSIICWIFIVSTIAFFVLFKINKRKPMNTNTRPRRILYFILIIGLSLLLFREYTYVHPYKPSFGWHGPRWTYASTKTFTWWFLLFSSIILTIPLFRRQGIGSLGLILLIAVCIRPVVQNKFPEETVNEFFSKRKKELNKIVSQTDAVNHVVVNQEIRNAGFEKLIVKDSIYYFFFFSEGFMLGICKAQKQNLPQKTETFERIIKFNKIEKDWYELDY